MGTWICDYVCQCGAGMDFVRQCYIVCLARSPTASFEVVVMSMKDSHETLSVHYCVTHMDIK